MIKQHPATKKAILDHFDKMNKIAEKGMLRNIRVFYISPIFLFVGILVLLILKHFSVI